MNELRSCRRELGLSQAELAERFGVPLNSFRMWDSGIRSVPEAVLEQAKLAAANLARDREPLPLKELARELTVHVRTLQAAARTGRLEVRYSTRSVFGRPQRTSTRAAGSAFLQTHYKRYGGQAAGRFHVPRAAPRDYQFRLRRLRRCLKLSQSDLAELVGAANKAVVYQWESGKRMPSPLFWEQVLLLERAPLKSPASAKIIATRP